MNTRWAVFCNIGSVISTHQFFETNPREAARMDPQQRYAQSPISPSRTPASHGVIVGQAGRRVCRNLHVGLTSRRSRLRSASILHAYTNITRLLAATVFYFFVVGPSAAVDTACLFLARGAHVACRASERRERLALWAA
jgi:acyl transferase domain-containing protein